jgi:hypothetical protein
MKTMLVCGVCGIDVDPEDAIEGIDNIIRCEGCETKRTLTKLKYCDDCGADTVTCAKGKEHCSECWGHEIETNEPCKLCEL